MMEKGAKWVHKQTGAVVVIGDYKEKNSTVIIEFENKSEKPRTITTASLKRLYKPLEQPEKRAEDVKATETAKKAEKPVKESSKKSEPKPKRERKPRVDNSAEVDKIVKFVYSLMEQDGCVVGVPRSEEMKFRALRYGKKQFCKLMWSAKSVRLYFREEAVNTVSEEVEKVNYNLPYLYIVESADKAHLDNIKKMFKIAIGAQKK